MQLVPKQARHIWQKKLSAKSKTPKTDDVVFDDSEEIKCCGADGQFLPADLRHDECFPIAIPANDPFHGARNRRCMEFVRSMAAQRSKCSPGPREQVIESPPNLIDEKINPSDFQQTYSVN